MPDSVRPALLLVGSIWLLVASACLSSGRVPSAHSYSGLAYAPRVEVIDTTSSLGPLASTPREVGLDELVAWHGHPCDGLVAAAVGMAYGLSELFPDGPIDRTDLCAATNRSACYGDVAAFLTGARHRYGSLTIDPALGDEWVVHRRTTGRTVRVRLRDGVKPAELPGLEAELRAASCPPDLMERVAVLQDRFARSLLEADPTRLFVVEFLPAYPYPLGERRPDTQKRDCPPPSAPAADQAATSAP